VVELSLEEIRAKVILSDLKMKILEAIELFEVERKKKPNSVTIRISIKGRIPKKPEYKSQYRIAEELGKKYASVVRALRDLENYEVIISHSKGRKVTYVWTYLGVLLFPELASISALEAFWETAFGDIDDFVDFISKKINANEREAEELIFYFCNLFIEFLEWLREQVILPLEKAENIEIPKLENNEEYWRELSIVFLLSHFMCAKFLGKVPVNAKSSKSLKTGIQKLLKYGSKWFAEMKPIQTRKTKKKQLKVSNSVGR